MNVSIESFSRDPEEPAAAGSVGETQLWSSDQTGDLYGSFLALVEPAFLKAALWPTRAARLLESMIQRGAWFDREILLLATTGIARSQVFVPPITAATYTQNSNDSSRTELV